MTTCKHTGRAQWFPYWENNTASSKNSLWTWNSLWMILELGTEQAKKQHILLCFSTAPQTQLLAPASPTFHYLHAVLWLPVFKHLPSNNSCPKGFPQTCLTMTTRIFFRYCYIFVWKKKMHSSAHYSSGKEHQGSKRGSSPRVEESTFSGRTGSENFYTGPKFHYLNFLPHIEPQYTSWPSHQLREKCKDILSTLLSLTNRKADKTRNNKHLSYLWRY